MLKTLSPRPSPASVYVLADRRVELVGVSEVPLISMDYVLIQQVLTNLLENACAYSAADTLIEIAATMEGRTLRLAVKDRGSGIDVPQPERLFEQFERGTTLGSGIGLGPFHLQRPR